MSKVFSFLIVTAILCSAPTILVSGLKAENTKTVNEPLQSFDEHEEADRFRDIIATATTEHPLIAERVAKSAEAEAAQREALSAVFPTIDIAVSANRSLASEFSNNPDNAIERSRGAGRADLSGSINQTLLDFGSAGRRIAGASARIEAALADIDTAYEVVALRAIGAWIDVAAYTRLTELANAHLASQHGYRAMLQSRIDQGVSATADHARLDSAIAISEQRDARFRQELGNATARFQEVFGAQVAQPAKRAPTIELPDDAIEEIILASQNTAPVRSAKATATGAQNDARATRAETLPNIAIAIDAGRFGIFEQNRNDYDVRARVTLRYRFFGPGDARADQAAARASAALSRSYAVIREAEREARISWSDVKSLRRNSAACEAEYRASLITRDAEIARFRIARGTMFDVLLAEERYFNSAVNYLRSTSELDAARYVLLTRVGRLLPELGIIPDYAWRGRQ